MKFGFYGHKIAQQTGTPVRLSLFLLTLLLLAPASLAQERKIDPTWLHRYLPDVKTSQVAFATDTCHYKPAFGEGDGESRTLQSVSRFGEIQIGKHGECQSVVYGREEEIYFILEGTAVLHYGDESHAMRKSDFTYLPPGVTHSIANESGEDLRVLVMGFKIPAKIALNPPSPHPKILNLADVKEETVDGHPSSVLYKLLIGPQTARRDALDESYVVTSFFLMDFAPGGTNFPHHHEIAEEIYLVLDGNGEIVAGSGMDGIEAQFPAKTGDAYYFRPNCTVGFYNQNQPGAKAYILAVRSRIPFPKDAD
ncbi:MAG: cupin domain-containing protein [Candidatus Acidiferrales bacterium]